MRQGTWRLRIAKIIPFTYQKLPCTKQPYWNSSNNISKTICPLGKDLMVGIRQLSQMFKSFHSDTNDGRALNSLHGVLQTIFSKLNALLKLRIAKIFPFRYQRWPWTKQPSWNSSNNIFKSIFSLEQKIDGSLQGKIETQNCFNHSIQISKMAIHSITIFIFFKKHLPLNPMSLWAETWLDSSGQTGT